VSVFKTTGESGNTLDYKDHPTYIDGETVMQPGIAILNAGGSGSYVTLTDRDRRELAFELLEDLFDVHYNTGLPVDGQIMLTPKRPAAEVGQFYRVVSNSDMSPEFQGDPLVRISEVYPSGDVWVKTKDGSGSEWPRDRDGLVGPLEVEEVPVATEWREVVA
jgi:hypothetical protein